MAFLMKIKLIVGLAALAMGIASYLVFWKDNAAPEVSFATLSGDTFSTSALRGKVVLVNFWATSCVTCVEEMPRMVEIYVNFAARGYEMVAVAMSYDHPNHVAAFARSRKLPFKVALDGSGAIARGFGGVRATPTSFLIDRQGRIVAQFLGEPDWARFHALLDKALRAPA
jgi:peroxiredoxin